jgi:hypothetical protein
LLSVEGKRKSFGQLLTSPERVKFEERAEKEKKVKASIGSGRGLRTPEAVDDHPTG